jgi:hypothetical protein
MSEASWVPRKNLLRIQRIVHGSIPLGVKKADERERAGSYRR